MRRILPLLLAVLFLMTQWGLVAHAYQDHDDEVVCELCLAKNQHDHVLLSSAPVLNLVQQSVQDEASQYHAFSPATLTHYSSRAPPHSL